MQVVVEALGMTPVNWVWWGVERTWKQRLSLFQEIWWEGRENGDGSWRGRAEAQKLSNERKCGRPLILCGAGCVINT